MNGSPSHPACKQERGTTAAEICVFIPHEAGVAILVRAAASPPPAESSVEPAPAMDAGPSVVWRRRRGSRPVAHAYAANACVDVPFCGSRLAPGGTFEELPPPPANLGPYRRCKRCMAAVGRTA
ncbi:MAG: hypothetical protein ABFC89_05375 [Methanospirillum sp.]